MAVGTYGTSHGDDVRLQREQLRQIGRSNASGKCQLQAIPERLLADILEFANGQLVK